MKVEAQAKLQFSYEKMCIPINRTVSNEDFPITETLSYYYRLGLIII